MSCRLFFDEHVPQDIADALRNAGHEALSARDAGMLGEDDDVLLEFATRQGRVFLTAGYSDFARLSVGWNREGKDFPGIVLMRLPRADYSPGEYVAHIEQHITPEPSRLQNSLTWLPLLLEE